MASFPTVRVAAIQATPLIGGPLYDEEGIVEADCDLRLGLHAKRWLTRSGSTAARTLSPGAARE